ncbi:protein of unknown function [Pararobbsia alpina]
MSRAGRWRRAASASSSMPCGCGDGGPRAVIERSLGFALRVVLWAARVMASQVAAWGLQVGRRRGEARQRRND